MVTNQQVNFLFFMKKNILFLFSLILCVGKAFAVAEHIVDKKNVDPVVQNINRFIATLNPDSQHLQGGAIAILYKGKPVYEKTFGYRIHGQSQPINVHTLFPLASVSKTITAMMVAMMLDQNRLDLDKPYKLGLSRVLNLRTILSHTTGYDFSGNEAIEQGKDRNLIKKLLTQQRPSCKTEECFFYSNAIFDLTTEILKQEKTSLQQETQKLQALLQTDQLQLLPRQTQNIAYPHHHQKTLPLLSHYAVATPASAGFYASLEAMIKIFQLEFGYRPDLVKAERLKEFQRPIVACNDLKKFPIKWFYPVEDLRLYYGLGFRILKHRNQELIFHSGFVNGTTSVIAFIPQTEVGIIILLNQDSKFSLQTAVDLWTYVS